MVILPTGTPPPVATSSQKMPVLKRGTASARTLAATDKTPSPQSFWIIRTRSFMVPAGSLIAYILACLSTLPATILRGFMAHHVIDLGGNQAVDTLADLRVYF